MKKLAGRGFLLAVVVLTFVIVRSMPVHAEVDCLTCHGDLPKGKVVHPAIQMGCTTCHSGIDASEVPHKNTGKEPKGLSAAQPELCYGCHDKTQFTKKTVHAAIGMGCTACHNPHSSKNDKLLNSEPPGLCYGCHDKKEFEDKTVHAPVAAGMCTSCHSPHSTDGPKLLLSEPPALCFNCHDKAEFTKKDVHAPVAAGMCLQCHTKIHASKAPVLLAKRINLVCTGCHGDIMKGPHPVAGLKRASHPLELKRDPFNKGKSFTCVSCHNPHSSDSPKLFRFKASSREQLCVHCHNY